MTFSRPAAPGGLGHIEMLCNSARFLYAEDALADLASARAWLRDRADVAAELDDVGHQELLRVREAIRDHLDGGSDQSRQVLNESARHLLAPPRWTDTGPPELTPATATSGMGTLLGGMLATLATEELAGRRARLKVCHARDCRWVFYDRSPGNNSVWCSMSICGARHKMRLYRTRRADTPSR